MIKYEISPQQYLDALVFAEKVNENNQRPGVAERKMTKRKSGVEVHLLGRLGEIAFGAVYFLPLDESVTPRRGGPDFITERGNKVDVKTHNAVPNPDLLVPVHDKRHGMDMYFMVKCGPLPLGPDGEPVRLIEEGFEMILVGYVYSENVFLEKNLTDFGYGPTYRVRVEDLIKVYPK